MTKNVEKKFFEENPNAFQDYIQEYMEEALQHSPPNLKKLIEEKYEEAKPILDEQYTWFSNDLFTHHILANIIEEADEEIKEELEKVWIGKINKDEVNAAAHSIDPDFEGYLITLNSELDYLLHNVCETLGGELLMNTNKDKEYEPIILLLFVSNYTSLPDLNERAISIKEELLSPEIQKKLNNFSNTALIGATTFIVAHEIGHHFLKHTEVKSEFIGSYRDMYIRGGNINHEYEYAADEFAIDLMLKNKLKNATDLSEGYIPIEYLAGPFLSMLALALVDPTPHLSSDSHPSIKDRFESIKKRIALIYKDEEIVETLFAVMNRMIEYTNQAVKPGQPNRWNGKEWWK
ncbi:hypothetical protein Q0N51_25435 [Priestia megaterium]|uniref:hypothetical protein n=1 Tax=Priestia megaterium TaxID=1404 RepID=UPI0034575BC1